MGKDAWKNKPPIDSAYCQTGTSENASVSVSYTTSDGEEEDISAEGADLFLTLIEALNKACNVNFELQYFSVQRQDDGNYSATVKLHDKDKAKFPLIEGKGKASNVLQAIIDAYMDWDRCYTRVQNMDIQ